MAGHVKISHKSKENISNNVKNAVSVKNVTDLKSKLDVRSNPTPEDFMQFFPWACGELGNDKFIYIKRCVATKTTPKTKDKANGSQVVTADMKTSSSSSQSTEFNIFGRNAAKFVIIEATFLPNDDLTALRFNNNRHISRLVFKILGLVIRFYPKLSNITINRGLDQFIIYEISKFISKSHITELILDNCPVSQGNYHILLDEPSHLTHLSLARCAIGDRALSLICKKLVYPKPVSKTLTILNLSTNDITDIGARDLAKCLRSNRRLRYINLCGNLLTDTGAETILSSLMEFQLTREEFICCTRRYRKYLKAKYDFIMRVIEDIQDSGEYEKEKRRNRSTLTVSNLRRLKPEDAINEPFPDKRTFYFRKALGMLPSLFEKFDDPFNEANTNSKDGGGLLSNGNEVLCYLNLSYNSLGELTVKKLIRTLKYQQSLNREQKGLYVVRLDGNPIPRDSKNLGELEDLFDKMLSAVTDSKLKYAKSRAHMAGDVKGKLPKK